MIIKTSLASIVTLAAAAAISSPAIAADLGGTCCGDLEERIAELEATTARKGNRKISLHVYGQVNKALLSVSGDATDSNQYVIENSNSESFFGVKGEANIGQGWAAGYILEVGVGGYTAQGGNPLGSPDEANGVYTRRSFVYVDGPVGKVSLGLNSQATDGITDVSEANTNVAARKLSLRPINGPQVGDALDIFDGSRANVIRYDSHPLAGLTISASWANGSDDPVGTKDGDVWDIALHWSGKGAGFLASAGVGYRKGVVVPTIGAFASFGDQDITVISGSASLKHVETGLFVSAAAGQFDYGVGDVTAYHAQGGVERKWNDLGATSVFLEIADSNDLDLKLYGAGIVQSIDAAGMDVYATGRRINDDVDILMLGARVSF